MKKIISVFLLLAICLSMVSCTSQAEKVKDKLSGSIWVFDDTISGKETMRVQRTYKFEDEIVDVHVVSESTGIMQFMNEDCWYYGGYDVNESTITIYISAEKNEGDDKYSTSDRGKMTLFYTYKNGVLKLFADAEHTMELK